MDTLSTKTRALLLRPLKTTKMTKMAGVAHAKTLFAKNPVFCTPELPEGDVFGTLELEPDPPSHHRIASRKIILTTTPPPIFAKKYDPKICHTMGSVWHKSRLESRHFYRKHGIRTPLFMAYETPPPLLCHMNRFYGGWGWSLIC